jgi:hypothetical protein
MSLRHYWANDKSPNQALQPTPGDRRGPSEARGAGAAELWSLADRGYMAEERSNYMELLKYPIMVFSILLALIIAKYTLGISFGPISEVGPGGVKFSQETNAKLADLEGKLNGVLVEIDALRKTASLEDTTKRPQIEAEIFEATQTVSDQTAQLASGPTQ